MLQHVAKDALPQGRWRRRGPPQGHVGASVARQHHAGPNTHLLRERSSRKLPGLRCCHLTTQERCISGEHVTASDTLYERALPFCEVTDVLVQTVLKGYGRKFCGVKNHHPFELLLVMEGIEHRTTEIVTPRTNGFFESMNRTLLDECFRVAGQQPWYITPAEIRRDLHTFLRYYNLERSHQGCRLSSRTPAMALRDAFSPETLPPIIPEPEETTETEAEKPIV